MYQGTIEAARSRDRDWLIPVVLIGLLGIALCWATGLRPLLFGYNLVAWTGLVVVALAGYAYTLAVHRPAHPLKFSASLMRSNASRALAIVVGLFAFSAHNAAFGALKIALPTVVPFWADVPLSNAEAALFGTEPWRISHALFGWATRAIDVIYGSWFAVQLVAFYSVLLLKPSPLKRQALVSQALIWPILGIGCAYLLSSAGPIYFDRLYGGVTYAPLLSALQNAPIALTAAELLWSSQEAGGIGMGISAMPSLHIGLCLWLALVVRGTRLAPFAWAYYGLIWIGSVHLGWHYASDGLVSSIGVLLIWRAVEAINSPRPVQHGSANAVSSAIQVSNS